jgi:DNA-binding GntR family transcriptional regulator
MKSKSPSDLVRFDAAIALPRGLWESIAVALRRAILLGELPSGLHLEEPALARKFGVSRVPVHDALIRLEQEGLVGLEPRRGAFVVGMTGEDVHDLYAFRRVVETYAIRRAAERIDAADLAQLDALVDQMEDAVGRHQPQLVAAADVAFHRQTVLLAGSRQFLAAWDRVAGLIGAILSVTDMNSRDWPAAVEGHRDLVSALRERDPDAAELRLHHHLEAGELVMQGAMCRARSAARASGG